MRRTVVGLLGMLLVSQMVAGTTSATAAKSDQAGLVKLVRHDRFLSPNADGRHDQATVVFRLAERADVRVVLRDEQDRVLRRVRLGVLTAGRHAWRWGGGSASGTPRPDGRYLAVLRFITQQRSARLRLPMIVRTRPDDGTLVVSRPVVYPQATAVADRLEVVYLRENYSDEAAEFPQYFGGQLPLRTRLVVKAPSGERVHDATRRGYRPTFSWAARDALGEPLPAGQYQLRVTVRDKAGNARSYRRPIEVSWAQLVEQIWTETTSAALTQRGRFPTYDPGCNGCGEVCSAVPSERYAGGLSFRQPCDFGYAAVEFFGATPPFTPAPVDSWRVSATGGPTTPGETDVGSLAEVTMGPGDATVTTQWRQVDLTHYPYLATGQPAHWGFSTSQENDYDVATFTVEYRHYVPVT